VALLAALGEFVDHVGVDAVLGSHEALQVEGIVDAGHPATVALQVK
jgi:hypothetical protein